jgi:pimeloyl-ACP methyl ester carboxylesterase
MLKNVEILGLKINYLEKNEHASETLLFLHGNSHSHKTFHHQNSEPKLSDYRLIFLDLPGHGDSAYSENYSLTFLGEVISEFTKKLKLQNLIIIGHSLGGHIAINAAPEAQPKGLLLFGAPPIQKPFDPSSFLPNANAIALMQTDSAISEIEALCDELRYTGNDKSQAIADYHKTDKNFRLKVFHSVATNTHQDEVLILNSYKGETMFLLATEDDLISNDYILNKSNLPIDSLMIKYVLAGHSPQIESSELFNSHLADFAEKVFEKQLVRAPETYFQQESRV